MLDTRDDITIIKLIHSCKKHLFANLVDRYRGPVMSVVYRLTGDRNNSEDVAQEAFVKAFKYLKSFDLKRTFSSWLLKIATNCAYDHLQKSRREAFAALDDDKSALGGKEVDPSPTPEQTVMAWADNHALQEALMQLPDSYREILILRFVQDLSYQEIAEIQEIPMASVKVTLHRAKARLATLYKETENDA